MSQLMRCTLLLIAEIPVPEVPAFPSITQLSIVGLLPSVSRTPLRVLPDTGHLLIGERPDEVASLIEQLSSVLPHDPAAASAVRTG